MMNRKRNFYLFFFFFEENKSFYPMIRKKNGFEFSVGMILEDLKQKGVIFTCNNTMN
jgi:hypothetical protein